LRCLVLGRGDEVFFHQKCIALRDQLLFPDQAFLGFFLGLGLGQLLFQSEKFVGAMNGDPGLQLLLQLLQIFEVLLQAQASFCQGFLIHLHLIDGAFLEAGVDDSDQLFALFDGLAWHF